MKKALCWFGVVLTLALIAAWLWFTMPDGNLNAQPRACARVRPGPAITWLDANTYVQQEIDGLLSGWAKQNAIPVRAEHIAVGYDAALKTRINKGEIPDVWVNRAGADNGAFAPYSFDWTGEPILDRFDRTSLEQCMFDGRVVGLPWSREAYGIVYNKRMLKNAGIEGVPRTLSELEAACQALVAHGVTPFVNGYKEAWMLGALVSQFSRDDGTSGELFRYLDLSMRYGQDRPLETDWRACAYSLAKGEAAMSYLGDWCEESIKKTNPYVDIGFLPLPTSEDPEDARLVSSISWVLKLDRSSPELASAKALVERAVESGIADGRDGALDADTMRAFDEGRVSGWNQRGWPSGFETRCARALMDYLAGNADEAQTLEALGEPSGVLTKSLKE